MYECDMLEERAFFFVRGYGAGVVLIDGYSR